MAKVLIADDEPDVLESTRMLAEAMGYEAVGVGDAGAVLDAIVRERPGLVLQDLRMGRLNVAALMAALRSDPRTADIPVVFFSANADLPAVAARLGAWGYLAKPFGLEELRHVLRQAFGDAAPDAARTPLGMREDLEAAFRAQWRLVGDLARALGGLEAPPGDAARALEGMRGLALRLVAAMDRLRADLGDVADALVPAAGDPAALPPPADALAPHA